MSKSQALQFGLEDQDQMLGKSMDVAVFVVVLSLFLFYGRLEDRWNEDIIQPGSESQQRWMCISNVVGWLEDKTSIPPEGSTAEPDKV